MVWIQSAIFVSAGLQEEKNVVSFMHEQIIMCSQTQMALRLRPLFVGSYLQITWWDLGK